MENYRENMYPTLPKDGDGETFRLQQTCDALQKLENETKHYETVRKKYKRYQDFLSKVSVSAGTLSFISSASGVGAALSGVGLPAGASLGAIGLLCGLLSVFTGAIAKKVSHKVSKHEQTVAICQSKVNSIKDRISKALNDNKISDEEFHIIISELDKYNEMKRDIRTKNRKDIKKKHFKRGRTKKADSSRDNEKNTSGFNKSFTIKIEINRNRYKLPSAPPLYEL